jgi:calcium permeable stress-gated cation channel
LMIIMLVVTALYQVALNNALHPLLTYLPKSMDAEERRLLAEEHPTANGEGLEDGTYGQHEGEKPLPATPGKEGFNSTTRSPTLSTPSTYKKPNLITKFLRPDKYTDYAAMRRLVPKDVEIVYAEGQEDEAYFHPSITNTTPLLWVPRDPMGISREECHITGQTIPMTDEGAYLDEKNKIVWDAQDGRPPIYEEKVYY